MNVERFHAIVVAVLKDVQQYNYPKRLRQIADMLQKRVSEPQDAANATNADATITELREKLPNLQSNNFPPSWKELMYEHGFELMLGNELLAEIESILLQKEITPTIAAKKLSEIATEVAEDQKHFQAIAEGFKRFKFGVDDPEPGQAEMGVLIPRPAVHNGLYEFGREVTDIAKIVRVFQEINTGTREDPKIQSISSSDLSIFFLLDPGTALHILKTISQLIETYKEITKIKDQINQLKKDVPANTLDGAIEHVNAKMSSKIRALTEEITTEKDGVIKTERRTEIKFELKGALEAIAVRVDKGFEFEVRARPAEEVPKEAVAQLSPEQLQALQQIAEEQNQLTYVRAKGEPILSLTAKLPPDPPPKQD
jgi:hypothetical protein